MARKPLTDREKKTLKEIGSKLRLARDTKGWTQTDVIDEAKKKHGISVSLRTYQAIEAGVQSTLLTTMVALLQTVGLRTEAVLFNGTNTRHVVLHGKLQELLDAGGDWPRAAEINVDAVYLLYKTEKAEGATHSRAAPDEDTHVPGKRTASSS